MAVVDLKWDSSRMKYNTLPSISAILADKGIQLYKLHPQNRWESKLVKPVTALLKL